MQFTVNNSETSPNAEILIYDKIGKSGLPASGVGAKDFAEALRKIPENKPITVRINSPGGDVSDGLAIHNLLESRKSKITTVVDGYALSAASIIALAGSQLRMPQNALLMIHEPHSNATGTAEDMRQAAGMLDKHRDSLAGIYQRKSGKSRDEINRIMHEETWYTGTEAKAAGFADVVTEDQPATASFDLSQFKHPKTLNVDSKPFIDMTVNDFKGLIAQTLGLSAPADADKKLASAEAELAQARATVAQIREELIAAKADAEKKIAELSKTLSESQTSSIEALSQEKARAKKELEDKEADIDRRANAKAGEIARKQGVPAVKEEKPGATAILEDIVAKLEAIADPVERTKFYREHKDAINAAYANAEKQRKN